MFVAIIQAGTGPGLTIRVVAIRRAHGRASPVSCLLSPRLTVSCLVTALRAPPGESPPGTGPAAARCRRRTPRRPRGCPRYPPPGQLAGPHRADAPANHTAGAVDPPQQGVRHQALPQRGHQDHPDRRADAGQEHRRAHRDRVGGERGHPQQRDRPNKIDRRGPRVCRPAAGPARRASSQAGRRSPSASSSTP